MERDNRNVSTENQPKGSARNLSDTLDRAADSTDYHYGGDRGRAAEDKRVGEKPDSMTANIDDEGRPIPPPDGPARPDDQKGDPDGTAKQGQSTPEPAEGGDDKPPPGEGSPRG